MLNKKEISIIENIVESKIILEDDKEIIRKVRAGALDVIDITLCSAANLTLENVFDAITTVAARVENVPIVNSIVGANENTNFNRADTLLILKEKADGPLSYFLSMIGNFITISLNAFETASAVLANGKIPEEDLKILTEFNQRGYELIGKKFGRKDPEFFVDMQVTRNWQAPSRVLAETRLVFALMMLKGRMDN